jgi:hypothetical protein
MFKDNLVVTASEKMHSRVDDACAPVTKARPADVDARYASLGSTERVLCRLPCFASRDENLQVFAVWLVRPKQMVFSAMTILVLPFVTRAIEILNRRRIRMISVELTDRIVGYLCHVY